MNPITLHATALRAENYAPHSIANRESILRRLEAAAGSLTTLDAAEIARYLADAPVSDATRAAYFCQIRDFYRWAQTRGIVAANPCDTLRAPRRGRGAPRPMPTAEMYAIIEAATCERGRAMCVLAAGAGLRIHEVAKVRGEHFRDGGRTLTVLGKGGLEATIEVSDAVSRLARNMPRRGFWFPSSATSGHVPARSVGRLIKAAIVAAGFDYTPHQLRHWYGTELLRSGVDIRIVQELMRHVSIQSTQIYTLVDSEQQRRGIDLLRFAA